MVHSNVYLPQVSFCSSGVSGGCHVSSFLLLCWVLWDFCICSFAKDRADPLVIVFPVHHHCQVPFICWEDDYCFLSPLSPHATCFGLSRFDLDFLLTHLSAWLTSSLILSSVRMSCTLVSPSPPQQWYQVRVSLGGTAKFNPSDSTCSLSSRLRLLRLTTLKVGIIWGMGVLFSSYVLFSEEFLELVHLSFVRVYTWDVYLSVSVEIVLLSQDSPQFLCYLVLLMCQISLSSEQVIHCHFDQFDLCITNDASCFSQPTQGLESKSMWN